ncbi:MSC_0623 family F1-like ATPase-associated protein [Mycoplasma corogypsi]|uniref:MSC_0623 family F1-like ATPase-associated protein n=1 Tax=Mycoplasma corogypsi TaxID=2106 RepID=UPI0038735483
MKQFKFGKKRKTEEQAPKHVYTDAQKKYMAEVFASYENAAKAEKVITYEALINQLKIENNTSDEYPTIALIEETLSNLHTTKYDVLFDNFVLTFTRDVRFSLVDLVPKIAFEHNSGVKTVNLSAKQQTSENRILSSFNHILKTLLEQNFYVYINKYIIVNFDPSSQLMQVYFAPEVSTNAFEEN